MRRHFNLFIIAVILTCLLKLNLKAEEGLPFPDLETAISMDVQNANLKDILKIFSIQSGLSFIASSEVQDRSITLYLDNVPVKEAMDKLFKAYNLAYELDEDTNIFIVTESRKPRQETITKVFMLKYASVSSAPLIKEISSLGGSGASSGGVSSGGVSSGGVSSGGVSSGGSDGITAAVRQLLSKTGNVIEDYRTNSLIVIDTPARMPIIAEAIASLDVSVPQVMLEVEMLDVSKSVVDKIGFEFGENPITLVVPGNWMKKSSKLLFGPASSRRSEGAVTLGHTYAQLLDFLRTQTDTKTLARPRLMTLNNQSAEIKIETNEVIGEEVVFDDQGNVTNRTAEREKTGVSLRVTPQINTETNEITMWISPKFNEAAPSAFGGNFRDPEERITSSLVRVTDGETIILGGLIRKELYTTVIKLPFLGDIPILGALFRHKNKNKDKDRELLVFITPRIIKEGSASTSRLSKVSIPEREQDAGSVLLAPR